MNKKSFVIYISNYEAIKEMTFEEKGMLFEKIFCYQLNIDFECKNSGVNMAFNFIKEQLDINNEKYKNKVEANKINGKLGGRPKKENLKTQVVISKTQTNPKNLDNDNDNDNDNVNDINIAPSETKVSTGDIAKASKHKYGQYKKVLLKDEELQALRRDYSNSDELIKYLDEYIEMKGYKAKSHYLAIKKWVVDAVKKQNYKKTPTKNNFEQRNYDDADLNNLYANLGE